MRLDEGIHLYLDTFDKQSTRTTYRKALKTLSEQLGPGRDLEELTPADLIRVFNYLNKQPYAPATLRQRLKSIKTFFNWLQDMELIESNPARVIKVKRAQRPRTRAKAITDDELKLLLDYVQYRSRRDFALFLFLADTGCRIGGAANLQEKDIDWVKREATVTEKGDKTRQVKFGVMAATALRRHLISRKATEGDYVFSEKGGKIKPDNLSQRVRRACAGLRKNGETVRTLSSHSFRHRKGHQFGDAKINPSVAAEALGHESVLTTLQNYYPDDWESAAAELDKLSLTRDDLKHRDKHG